MARSELKKLLKKAKEELDKRKRYAELTKQSSDEIAKSAANSPSQSGDRTHAESQARITKEALINLQTLIDELEEGIANQVPKKIKPPCYIEIKYDDSEVGSFFFLHNTFNIEGEKIVSRQSELGKRIADLETSDNFEMGSRSGKVLFIK